MTKHWLLAMFGFYRHYGNGSNAYVGSPVDPSRVVVTPGAPLGKCAWVLDWEHGWPCHYANAVEMWEITSGAVLAYCKCWQVGGDTHSGIVAMDCLQIP